jgi:hypothetical protein
MSTESSKEKVNSASAWTRSTLARSAASSERELRSTASSIHFRLSGSSSTAR